MKQIEDLLEEFADYLNEHYHEISDNRGVFYSMYNDMMDDISQIGDMNEQEIGYAGYIRSAIVDDNFIGYKYEGPTPKIDQNKTRIKNTEIDPFDEEVWYEEDFIK